MSHEDLRRPAAVEVVVIPFDTSQPLYSINVAAVEDRDTEDNKSLASPHIRVTQVLTSIIEPEIPENVVPTLLLRQRNDVASLYAFHDPSQNREWPNIHATRLAIACGLFSFRFHGNVVLVRGTIHNLQPLELNDILSACCISPDLRDSTLAALVEVKSHDIATTAVPEWIGNACRYNYQDVLVLRKLADVMNSPSVFDDDEENVENCTSEASNGHVSPTHDKIVTPKPREFVTKVSLCLHCRRPSSTLCSTCSGAYFCAQSLPCRRDG
jgi:hypothetical protein